MPKTPPNLEAIAATALDEATQDLEDETRRVRLWDDEWEQWHVDDDGEPTVELPAEVAVAYELAQIVWQRAQANLTAAVDALRESYPEEFQDDAVEAFRGDITPDQLAARIAGCAHPEDQRRQLGTTPNFRCQACGRYGQPEASA